MTGELFIQDDHVLAIQPVGSRLMACEIRDHRVEPRLPAFCTAVEKAAKASIDGRRLRGMRFDWVDTPVPMRRSAFRQSVRPSKALKTKSAVIASGDAESADLLVNRERRDFILRLAQLGKARSVDAQVDIDAAVPLLLEQEIVRKEFLLLCRKDSRTLCSIESREELDGELGHAFKCSLCGRPFSEELVEEIVALTSHGRKMLNGSHWMTVWVTGVLAECGVPLDKIHWGATAGEDEIDIVAEIQEQVIFFELKDREFGLGDAYPFTARVERYGASAGVIISMGGIAQEVEKFLKEQARSLERPIFTISGEEEVKRRLPSILRQRAKSSAIDLMCRVFMEVELDPSPILAAWADTAGASTWGSR